MPSVPAAPTPATPEMRARLRAVPIFADLSDGDLDWIAAQCQILELAEGDILARPGDPADRMFIILRGEIHSRPEKGAADEGRVYTFREGQLTGMIPFSRMTRIPRTVCAAVATRVAGFPASLFPELLRRIPALEPRLVALLADRVRQATRTEEQRDRLVSLGRLSAGLAHELNNPAAGAQRAVKELQRTVKDVARWSSRLGARTSEQTVAELTRIRGELRPGAGAGLPALDRADREDEVAAWLEDRGQEDGMGVAPTLVEAGADAAWLGRLEVAVTRDLLPLAVRWLEAMIRADDLLHTAQQATARVSTLVGAVKEYTFMDQAPVQEVDVHAGLDNTVRVLARKLEGITIVRQYAPDLPRIQAHGAELNQVWTNLIDNAADAAGAGGQIVLATAFDRDSITVQVRDNGPGIAPEVQPHIFDPFYTTKAVGQGTGLGLDIVRRVVEQHRGRVHAESRPGDTCFTVNLPLSGTAR